ncbi:hypothetical protein ACOME3_003114 [Neoechinorhynchus agilis]
MTSWYSKFIVENLTMYDIQKRRRLTPITGGSNIPSLNQLFAKFGIELGEHNIYINEVRLKDGFLFGNGIIRFPKGGHLITKNLSRISVFINQKHQPEFSVSKAKEQIAVIGWTKKPPFIFIHTDVTSVDSSYMDREGQYKR